MSEKEICTHCKNPVVRINYGKQQTATRAGAVENVFRHGYPRPYPVCSVNPIMDEDVEVVDEEAT
jgi:hypothetical protein